MDHEGDGQRSKVVIVDDNFGDFVLLSEYLDIEAPGAYDCVHAATFEDFISTLVDARAPDVVLIDCDSPDGLGLRNVRSAVEQLPTKPVIGMSERLMGEAARGALDCGVSHFICKDDLTPARLAQTVAYACANERRLRNLFERAHFDALTGLANRNLLFDRIGHGLERCQRSGEHVALLLIDLDDFKQVNDGFGHDVGDAYLRAVADMLRGAVRDADTVARLGGDEFAILLEGLRHAESAIQIAAKILDLAERPVALNGVLLNLSMSLGISLFSPEAARFSADWLCKAADTALYRAKSLGKNQYCVFTDELDQAMVDDLELDHAIRRGLDRGELLLHYQPIVTSDDHRLTAFEALLRWQHPVRGLIAPGTFLRAIEKLGFMSRVGEFVLRETLAQFAAWLPHLDDDVVMHVNVSGAQLNGQGFADFVAAEIAAAGVQPRRVCLELTESMLFEHSAAFSREVSALESLGVRFAIDDFGTGYGSYNYLKQFNVDCIKIDKCFVDALPNEATDRAIVQSIVGLAASLGLEVVAEGVENLRQADLLRSMGAVNLQGYLFHRPLSPHALSELIGAGNARRPRGIFRPAGAVA